MSKYIPPEVEIQPTAVDQQQKKQEGQDTAIGIPAEQRPTTPADIYKNRIDDLVKFLKHEIHAGKPDARADYQAKVIDMFALIMGMDYKQFEVVMDHLVKTIVRNPLVFNDNDLLAPVMAVENLRKVPTEHIQRYKQFMTFFVGMAKNIRIRSQYVAQYDVTKLISTWPQKGRENLHAYILR